MRSRAFQCADLDLILACGPMAKIQSRRLKSAAPISGAAHFSARGEFNLLPYPQNVRLRTALPLPPHTVLLPEVLLLRLQLLRGAGGAGGAVRRCADRGDGALVRLRAC